MILNVNNFNVSPAIYYAGNEKSHPDDKIKINFSHEWKRLRKQIDFYLPDSKNKIISCKYKAQGVKIPEEIFEKAGVYRLIIRGFSKTKSMVSGTVFISIMPEISEKSPLSSLSKGGDCGEF